MALDRLKPENLYEQARSAGLSHETALDVASATLVRGKLTGEWPDLRPPVADNDYSGPPATVDSALWLGKVGRALEGQWIWPVLARRDLPIITRTRVRLDDWWRDGCLPLDMENLCVGGRRAYTTARVPIGVCIDHDMERALAFVLSHLGQRTITLIEHTLLNETDLRHVSG